MERADAVPDRGRLRKIGLTCGPRLRAMPCT
jgi:hypothetical protein